MNKGQVLQNQASEREEGVAGQGAGKQIQRLVTEEQESQPTGSQTQLKSLPLLPLPAWHL